MLMRMLRRMKGAFISFMQGRYGIDNLCNFLMVLFFVFWLLMIFTRHLIFALFELAVLVYMWFRMLSRNIEKRRRENMRYLSIKAKLKSFFTFGKNKEKKVKNNYQDNKYYNNDNKYNKSASSSTLKQDKKRYRKTHVFIKCPECKNNLRLPKVKGKHTVRCPVCNASFFVKI